METVFDGGRVSAAELIRRLARLEEKGVAAAREAGDSRALDEARIRFLGRSAGEVSRLLRQLGALPPADRPKVGSAGNQAKQRIERALSERARALETQGRDAAGEDLDPTLPSRRKWHGTTHPVSQAISDIWAIFRELGFTRARGPEVEDEWHNFVALNTPLDHPAADEQDTIYLGPGVLLRSHTSPVQVRTMLRRRPPIRIIAPGMVYRRDSYDATHTPAFAQVEGLVVDERATFADLKGTLAHFARRFWGPGTQVRFRPSFFPFTEPSAEVDVKRVLAREGGETQETDWIEIMGAGMVDPAVLESVGYDSERYTGWAFGMGPGRIAMLRHGVKDLRLFYENDMRFLEQFR